MTINAPNNSSVEDVALIRGGKEYFDLLISLINASKKLVHLQTYIFDDDETGQKVGEALKAAAQRKVIVRVYVDGYASQVMSQAFINDLRNAGVQFRFFEPLLKSRYFYFGRRMHHKIFVADEWHALVGGINITDRYNDMPGQPAWLDFALYTRGGISRELSDFCGRAWSGLSSRMSYWPDKLNEGKRNLAQQQPSQEILVRRNDWVKGKKEITLTYQKMFRQAESEIMIMCSYFLPGKSIRKLLSMAARKGVKIKVITAGISDVKMAKRAERWLYDWLLRNNIELYEYQSTILHAKIAVCDRSWFTIGSYNVNNISAYASLELNLEVRYSDMARMTAEMLDRIISSDCTRITMEGHRRTRNVLTQFSWWFSYQFIRVVFNMLTFYYKQRRE